MWPASRDGRRRSGRLGVALAVSLLSHALVLLGARGWRVESRPAAPLVVTMVERGGGGDGAGAAAAPAAGAPAIAAPAPAKKAPVRPATRPLSRPVPARRAVAPPPAPVTAPAAADTGVEGSQVAGAGSVAAAGDGSGAGGPGTGGTTAGSGGGPGTGGDGLRAFCRSCPAPEYPGRARRQGWQGSVDVELAIGPDGAVQVARIGRSSGHATLDDVALTAARQSRFTVPAGGDGLRGQLRYRFVLDETAARR